VLIGISELYFRTKLLPLQGALTSMATCFTLCSQAFDRCVTSNTPSTSIRGHADPLSRALSQNGYGQNMKVIGRPLWDPIFIYIYIYSGAEEIEIPDANHAAFESLIEYFQCDKSRTHSTSCNSRASIRAKLAPPRM
jgi:hypothetical protein